MATELKRAIKVIREAFPDVWAIYLFGSFGTAFQREESDLDLALMTKEPINPLLLWELSQRIAREINREVHLVDLRQASTVFQNEIIRAEKRLFCQMPKECDQLESIYLAMYLRLNEERKEILEDLSHG